MTRRSWFVKPSQAVRMRLRFAAGERQCDIARTEGVSQTTVSETVLGVIHREVGGPIVLPVYRPVGDLEHRVTTAGVDAREPGGDDERHFADGDLWLRSVVTLHRPSDAGKGRKARA